MIDRPMYLEKIKRNRWNGEIKVIAGLRRVGKSTLLFHLFRDFLLSEGVKEDHIIQIELDKRRHSLLRNPVLLCEHVEKILLSAPHERFYLFIDEVQLSIPQKDRATGIETNIYDMLNELGGYPNLDVYVTGSNSKGLSSDIATEFRGRGTIIEVLPLSFAEFAKEVQGNDEAMLESYLRYGGMPRILAYDDPVDKQSYLNALYTRIYLKDIKERNRLGHEEILAPILDFVASEIGSMSNPNRIADAIAGRMHESARYELVLGYLACLKDSFLIKEAKRYDVKGKKYFDYPLKYYYTDLGLRNSRLNFRQHDYGHLMENLIYNELVFRGYSVDSGTITDNNSAQAEVDFVVNSGDRKAFIQSCWSLDGEHREELELKPLKSGRDFFPRIIIRHDVLDSHYDESGILHLSLFDFLYRRKEIF